METNSSVSYNFFILSLNIKQNATCCCWCLGGDSFETNTNAIKKERKAAEHDSEVEHQRSEKQKSKEKGIICCTHKVFH